MLRAIEEDGTCKIRIAMPLPVHVVTAIQGALGQLWPDAQIVQQADDLFDRGHVVISIDPKTTKYAALEDIGEAPEGEEGWELHHFSPGAMKMAAPDELAAALATGFFDAMDGMGCAVNYLEFPVHSRGAICVIRQDGLSPHQLREIAEKRVALLEQQLRDAGIEPTPPPPPGWEQTQADNGWLTAQIQWRDQLTDPDDLAAYSTAVRDFYDTWPADRSDRIRTRFDQAFPAPTEGTTTP